MVQNKISQNYKNIGHPGALYFTPKKIQKSFIDQGKQPPSRKRILKILNDIESYQLHKRNVIKFKRNSFSAPQANYQLAVDLIDFKTFEEYNYGFKYILIAVDIFSKRAYARGLKNKKAKTILQMFKQILVENKDFYKKIPYVFNLPSVIQGDSGGEFTAKIIQDYLKSKGINIFYSRGAQKNSIAERFILTLKNLLFRFFDLNQTRNWINSLQDILKTYNSTQHNTIKMTPNSATNSIENYIKIAKIYSKNIKRKQNDLKIGDWVRIANIAMPNTIKPEKKTSNFSKRYEQSYSRAIFSIHKVYYPFKGSYPMFLLHEFNGKKIKRPFYRDELLKVDAKKFVHNFKFPFEMIKSRKNKVLISYLGYPKSYDTWISRSLYKKSKIKNFKNELINQHL